MEMDLEVVPVLNKIDLRPPSPSGVAEEIEDIVGIDAIDRCAAPPRRAWGWTWYSKIVARVSRPRRGTLMRRCRR